MIIRPQRSSVYSAPHRTGVADWARVLSVDAQPQVAPRLHGDAKRGQTRPTAEAREHHYAMVRRGSTVRVRQRASGFLLLNWPFRCPIGRRLTLPTSNAASTAWTSTLSEPVQASRRSIAWSRPGWP